MSSLFLLIQQQEHMTMSNEQTNPVPQFDFFEKVRIVTSGSAKAALNGEIGTVLGRTLADDAASWFYGISVESDGKVWSFSENELTSTGEFSSQEDFFDGSSLRVRVDENGRGTVVSKKRE
jgi:hypothetical protein